MATPFNAPNPSDFIDFDIDGTRLNWTVYGFTGKSVKVLFSNPSRKVCEDWLDEFCGE